MIRTQIQFTEDQTRALKEVAHQERVSIFESVRRAVNFWLQNGSAASGVEAPPPTDSGVIESRTADQATVSVAREGRLVDFRRAMPPIIPFLSGVLARLHQGLASVEHAQFVQHVAARGKPGEVRT